MRGRGNTDSVVYRQSSVTASGTLSLASGRDTSILGAQANGGAVHASIGRNLLITSTQDSELVDIAQTNGALNASVCLPYVCYGNAVSVSGSAEKIALHGALGYLQARAGGGDGLAGMAAGAVGEWVGTQVSDYLRSNTSLTDSQRNTIQQWAALTAGGIVGGAAGGSTGVGAGAAVGLDAERYNRLLHPAVKPFISELAKKQTRFTEQELQQAARMVPANDRIGDGTRTSYDSEAEANAAGVDKVVLAPDGKYYEVVAASPEAVQYVTAQLRTGPAEIQNEFMAAQFDRIKFDAKPWYTEAQNAGIDMLVTSPAMGSNAPPATVGASKNVPAASANSAVAGEGSAQRVAEETAGLGRIATNPNGPDLTERAPNTILNQQAVRQLNSGILPGKPINGLGTPREMPASSNPNATAEHFAKKYSDVNRRKQSLIPEHV